MVRAPHKGKGSGASPLAATISVLVPMTHFLDIGANIGQTFDQYLQYQPHLFGSCVWCFEPSPRHFAGLIHTTALYTNRFVVRLCPFGLSDNTGFFEFFEKEDRCGDSFVKDFWMDGFGRHVANRVGDYTVLAATQGTSEFIASNIPVADDIIIKIDAEGSEYAILRDLLRHEDVLQRVKQLLVEWHDVPDNSPEKFKELFRQAGRPIEAWNL